MTYYIVSNYVYLAGFNAASLPVWTGRTYAAEYFLREATAIISLLSRQYDVIATLEPCTS